MPGALRRVYPIYKNVLQLGPFSGGLDTEIDPINLPPNVLQKCVNYIVRQDGVLGQRPTVQSHLQTAFGFPAVPTTSMFGKSLGSLETGSGNLTGFAAIGTATFASTTTSFRIKWYKYNPAARNWNAAFTDTTGTVTTTSLQASAFLPNGIVKYNDVYYIAVVASGLLHATSTTGTLAIYPGLNPPTAGSEAPLWGVDSNGNYVGLIGAPVIIKDRMVVVDPNNIYWSGVGDPSYWVSGTPSGTPGVGTGGDLLTSKEDGQQTIDFVVFDEELYYFKGQSVWKFSWTTDPSVDGINERVSDEIGATDHEIYDNELYVANGRGLYKLVNQFFTEISEPVRSQWRNGFQTSVNYNEPNYETPQWGFGVNKLDHLLLCGPLNANATRRYDETINDPLVGNYYLVYDFDTGAWSSWQFSANATPCAISGPTEKPFPVGTNPGAPSEYVWFGQTLSGGSLGTGPLPRLQNSFSVLTAELNNELNNSSGTDVGGDPSTGASYYRWKGNIFKTGALTLGDNTKWKRMFNCLIDGIYNALSSTPAPSIFGYEIDGASSPTIPIVPQVGRLAISAGVRFHNLSLLYDSITGQAVLSTGPSNTELTDINQITMEVSVSQKDTQ